MKELVEKIKKLFKRLADDISLFFLRIGIRHFKGRRVSIFVDDDELYKIERYIPRHKTNPTKISTNNYWAERKEKNNQYNNEFLVLDASFVSKLP